MTFTDWENNDRRIEFSTPLPLSGVVDVMASYLGSHGWAVEPEAVPYGVKLVATLWESCFERLLATCSEGGIMLGGWASLGRYPTGVQSGGIIETSYRFTLTLRILDFQDTTTLDATLAEDIDPFGEIIVDKGLLSVPSRIDFHNPLAGIAGALSDSAIAESGATRDLLSVA